jgi:hypothetical protein
VSDISQGEGWWQASDHKWYPPEQHPDFRPPPQPATPAPTPEPPAPAVSPPAPPEPTSNAKWIVAGVLAVVVVGVAAFLLFGRDDDKNDRVAITSATSSSSSSTSSSSTDASSSSLLSEAELQARMLSAAELGSTFTDGTFTVDSTSPTLCGQDNLNAQVPPVIDLGSQATDAATKAFFREELSVYKDSPTAAQAFALGTQGFSCTQGTTPNGQTFTLSPARDISSNLGERDAVAIDYQIGTAAGVLIAVQVDARIISFQFEAPSSVDRSTLPDALTLARRGLAKLKR